MRAHKPRKRSPSDLTAAMTNLIPNSGPSLATPRRIRHVPGPRHRITTIHSFSAKSSTRGKLPRIAIPTITSLALAERTAASPSPRHTQKCIISFPTYQPSLQTRHPRTPYDPPKPRRDHGYTPAPKAMPPGRHGRPEPPPFTATAYGRTPRSARRPRLRPRPRAVNPDRYRYCKPSRATRSLTG